MITAHRAGTRFPRTPFWRLLQSQLRWMAAWLDRVQVSSDGVVLYRPSDMLDRRPGELEDGNPAAQRDDHAGRRGHLTGNGDPDNDTEGLRPDMMTSSRLRHSAGPGVVVCAALRIGYSTNALPAACRKYDVTRLLHESSRDPQPDPKPDLRIAMSPSKNFNVSPVFR